MLQRKSVKESEKEECKTRTQNIVERTKRKNTLHTNQKKKKKKNAFNSNQINEVSSNKLYSGLIWNYWQWDSIKLSVFKSRTRYSLSYPFHFTTKTHSFLQLYYIWSDSCGTKVFPSPVSIILRISVIEEAFYASLYIYIFRKRKHFKQYMQNGIQTGLSYINDGVQLLIARLFWLFLFGVLKLIIRFEIF